MLEKLTHIGFQELGTPEEVDITLKDTKGTPSVALLKDGKIIYILERHGIEGRTSQAIAEDLVTAFQVFCGEGDTSPEANLEPGETSSSDPCASSGQVS